MKTNNTPLLALMLLFALSSLHCKKPTYNILKQTRPTKLPPITTEGKNTFGCLVGGELLVPYPRKAIKDNFTKFYYGVKWGKYDGTLEIVATMEGISGRESKTVGLYLNKRIFDIGEYELHTDSLVYDPSNPGGIHNYTRLWITDETGNTTFESFGVPNPYSGRLKILRLDTLQRIVAGTFFFDAVNKEDDTIKVTDGRFDFKY
ncbi:MAG: hypothetical protein J5I91_01900 [Bacteroidetes bacterium]|nr:hypothetical protein [Bacteroidota bacterium]